MWFVLKKHKGLAVHHLQLRLYIGNDSMCIDGYTTGFTVVKA